MSERISPLRFGGSLRAESVADVCEVLGAVRTAAYVLRCGVTTDPDVEGGYTVEDVAAARALLHDALTGWYVGGSHEYRERAALWVAAEIAREWRVVVALDRPLHVQLDSWLASARAAR